MTDIRARLAAALREAGHQWVPFAEDNRSLYDHLADALLSLPGIAIVELPPVTIERDTYRSWLFTEAGEVESVTYPASDGEVAVSGVGTYTPAEAMVFAAALLAAAVQAQEEQ